MRRSLFWRTFGVLLAAYPDRSKDLLHKPDFLVVRARKS